MVKFFASPTKHGLGRKEGSNDPERLESRMETRAAARLV